jgi:hypothetical protein
MIEELANPQHGLPEVVSLTLADKSAISNLTIDQARMIKWVIGKENGLVVDYNITVSALLRCNTAIYMLGSAGQSIAIFFYLVKYMTKDGNMLANSVSLIAKARRNLLDYRTSAREGESQDDRNVKQFANHVLNSSEGGTREMADTTVAYANLGFGGHISSHNFHYLFGWDLARSSSEMHGTRMRTENPLESEDVGYGSVPMYKTETGDSIAVTDAQLYSHRVHSGYEEVTQRILCECINQYEMSKSNVNSVHLLKAYGLHHDNLKYLNAREFKSFVKLERFPQDGGLFYDQLVQQMNHPSDDEFKTTERKTGTIFIFSVRYFCQIYILS